MVCAQRFANLASRNEQARGEEGKCCYDDTIAAGAHPATTINSSASPKNTSRLEGYTAGARLEETVFAQKHTIKIFPQHGKQRIIMIARSWNSAPHNSLLRSNAAWLSWQQNMQINGFTNPNPLVVQHSSFTSFALCISCKDWKSESKTCRNAKCNDGCCWNVEIIMRDLSHSQ